MKIALAQLNPTIGDLVNNAQKILHQAHLAHQQGANLLLTPELSLCGYPPKDLLLNPSFVEKTEAQLHQLAQQLPPNLAVLVGTITPNLAAPTQGEKELFNSGVLLAQGSI
ncbi:MAG: nitrilase-related carbon-nitrogen hydrolase, partial [Microcystaceae cyanobacterium]